MCRRCCFVVYSDVEGGDVVPVKNGEALRFVSLTVVPIVSLFVW